jgi:hypothetical protein
MRQTPDDRWAADEASSPEADAVTMAASQDEAIIAVTDPTGAPNSANPRVPSVRPRWVLTPGMYTVQDANISP